MTEQILSSGAEAVIIREGGIVIKRRVVKGYRIKEIDDKIRKLRTRAEAKILEKVSAQICVPTVFDVNEKTHEIKMDFIDGARLSVELDNFEFDKQKEICFKIGESVSKIHVMGVIHGDLTTSNMILKDDNVYFIDFGLGYQNGKYEDKAVDLHVLRQALEAKHFRRWDELFDEVRRGYLSIDKKEGEKVIERFVAVERRGRYKH